MPEELQKQEDARTQAKQMDGLYHIMIATHIAPERMLFKHCDIGSNF